MMPSHGKLAGLALPAAALLTGCIAPIVPPPGLLTPAPPVAVMAQPRAEVGLLYGPLALWEPGGDDLLLESRAAGLSGRYTLAPASQPGLAIELGLQQVAQLNPLQHSFASAAATAWLRPDGAATDGAHMAFGGGLQLGLGDAFGYLPTMPSAGAEGSVQIAGSWRQRSAVSTTFTMGYAAPLMSVSTSITELDALGEPTGETRTLWAQPIRHAGLELRYDRRGERLPLGGYGGLGALFWFDTGDPDLQAVGYLHGSAGVSW